MNGKNQRKINKNYLRNWKRYPRGNFDCRIGEFVHNINDFFSRERLSAGFFQ